MTPFNYENLEDIHKAINGLLPCDIRIRERLDLCKIYIYKDYNDAIMDPFLRHYACHNVYKLNVAAMRDAAKLFVGKHDFSAFANNILRFDVNEMVLLKLTNFFHFALLVFVGKNSFPPGLVKPIQARDRLKTIFVMTQKLTDYKCNLIN
ncbi:hypothetical protein ACJIZ3_023535 [Penstemon smallii]|uniref:Uncharacterized protein n=1 Tax=Penstemon smallii TaxID=265156 RepID=A0ABD3TPB8_9LAMI